jgi:hypothetical protein
MTLDADAAAFAIGESIRAYAGRRRLAPRLVAAARAMEFASQLLAGSFFGRAPGMAHRLSTFAIARALALR